MYVIISIRPIPSLNFKTQRRPSCLIFDIRGMTAGIAQIVSMDITSHPYSELCDTAHELHVTDLAIQTVNHVQTATSTCLQDGEQLYVPLGVWILRAHVLKLRGKLWNTVLGIRGISYFMIIYRQCLVFLEYQIWLNLQILRLLKIEVSILMEQMIKSHLNITTLVSIYHLISVFSSGCNFHPTQVDLLADKDLIILRFSVSYFGKLLRVIHSKFMCIWKNKHLMSLVTWISKRESGITQVLYVFIVTRNNIKT